MGKETGCLIAVRKDHNMINTSAVTEVQREFAELFDQLSSVQSNIRERLIAYADGKTLKGNELVGWRGEIYGKLLLGGRLVDDSQEHDIETSEGARISVKARRGRKSGWQRTSAIPKIEGDDCPTHLLFVHLNDDYSVDRMWLYQWCYLKKEGRFKPAHVRGKQRAYIFKVEERKDSPFIIYGPAAKKPLHDD